MSLKVTKQEEDYSKWYHDIVLKAELADYSPVKGCMVIRPNGYAIWEKIQQTLDRMIKETGHQNAYFPLFIPESFLKKEKEHVEGFAPECAVVTHGGGKLLEEPLVVRPTSETIMYHMYAKWIQSYRDLPLKLNQWANVVRWEKRTRLFLRTTEFLWQEGHTAHATRKEAEEETHLMLDVYRRFAEDYLALPVLTGRKTAAERFAGAVETLCIEAMMQDKKGLQAGTSHLLGQNFAKAFDVKFQNEKGEWDYVWQTSWGVSSRLVGALIMAHSDDQGLVLPPKIAPTQIVIVPIYKTDDEKAAVLAFANKIGTDLRSRFSVHLDDREQFKPGYKYNHWEQQGVPLRLEIGPRDVASQHLMTARRTGGSKTPIPAGEQLAATIEKTFAEIQQLIFEKAKAFREVNTHRPQNEAEFREQLDAKGGFYCIDWCGDPELERKISDETKATIRLIPFDQPTALDLCLFSGKKAIHQVIWGRAY